MFRANLHIKSLSKVICLIILAAVLLPSMASGQTKEVVAEKGDGIFRLLKRYGLSASDYMQDFITLNKDALGKDNSLIAGAKYKLPDGATAVSDVPDQPAVAQKGIRTERHKIFGKQYEDVVIESDQLKGAVYYLMSGHGGPDPGALGKYHNHNVAEDEYAYDVTLRLARNLISEGATVYMITRDPNDGIRDESFLKLDKDEVCYPSLTIPLNQLKRLRQRSDAVNKLYAKNKGAFQRMVAIHVDSRSRAENIDVFFYHDKRSETGEKAAKILQQTFAKKYQEHQPGRGYGGTVTERNLYVVKNTYPPAVYIELGNVNHQRDIQRLIIPTNRQALANWLYEGLVQDFKANK